MKDKRKTLGIIIVILLFACYIFTKIPQPEESIIIDTDLYQNSLEREYEIQQQELADYADCIHNAEQSLRLTGSLLCSMSGKDDETCDKFTEEKYEIAKIKSIMIVLKAHPDFTEAASTALEQYNYDLLRCDSL